MANSPKVRYTSDTGLEFTSMFIYGLAGSGKTPLAATLTSPTMIVTAEPGLKSLARVKMPFVVGYDFISAKEVFNWLKSSSEARSIVNVFFDGISALSDVICVAEKKKSNDARKFSPATYAATMEIVNDYISLTSYKRNVIMTCKAIESQKTTETVVNGLLQPVTVQWIDPYAVVPKLGPSLPYNFDDVFYISRQRDPLTGQEYSRLTCRANDNCVARNRFGMLDLFEQANLTSVMLKNGGVA